VTLRLGLSSGALYPEVPTEEVPIVAARLGVADVELMLQTRGEYDPAFIRLIAGNCRAADVRVHAIHTFQSLHPFATPYRRRTEEARALFDRAIAAAVELGARAVVWHGLRRDEARGPDDWERFVAVTAELAAACGAAGVTLAIENVSWCVVSSVRDVMALAARLPEVGPPEAIGFAFDPFQAAEAGANPFMVLAGMEGRIVDVHVSDHREGDPAARHLPPGDGDLPWPALIRAIANSGYDGPLIAEGALGSEPGATMARIRGRFDPLLVSLAPESDPCAGSLPPGVLEGIRLFNERKFYECHEEIEHEWHAERGPVRRLYQGILQIGVGFHHARNGNHRGAVLLLTDGIEKTSGFVPTCRGVDTARLVAESQACLERIVELGPEGLGTFDWETVPFVWTIGQEGIAPSRR
jgi:sugar phosphate isomerase/epimerase/predicted metal-dependent hydrolase